MPAAPPVARSSLREPATELARLLVGRWEGTVELPVAERTLFIDALTLLPDGKWQVQARYGFTDRMPARCPRCSTSPAIAWSSAS